jgi:hypothetical protein
MVGLTTALGRDYNSSNSMQCGWLRGPFGTARQIPTAGSFIANGPISRQGYHRRRTISSEEDITMHE